MTKSYKLVSVASAVSIILTMVSGVGASAYTYEDEYVSQIKSAKILSVADDALTGDPDDIMYGAKVRLTLNNGKTKDFVINDISARISSDESAETLGYEKSYAEIRSDYFEEAEDVWVVCKNFVSDYAEFEITNMYTDEVYDTLKVSYPSDYELPYAFCKDGIAYSTNADGTLTARKYVGSEDVYELTIPEEIGSKQVKAIDKNVFSNMEQELRSLYVPATVTEIGKNAFGSRMIMPESLSDDFFAEVYNSAEGTEFEINVICEDEDLMYEIFAGAEIQKVQEYDYYYFNVNATREQILEADKAGDMYISERTEIGVLDAGLFKYCKKAEDKNEIIEVAILSVSEKTIKSLASKYGFEIEMTDVNKEYGIAAAVAKAKICDLLRVTDEEGIFVFATYMNIDAELYYNIMSEKYSDNVDLSIRISANSTSAYFVKYFIAQKYFDGCYYYYSDGFIYIKNASPEQVKALIEDDKEKHLVNYIMEAREMPYEKSDSFVLRTEKGSAAERFALENGIKVLYDEDVLGDVDMNGRLDVNDATLLQRYAAELAEFSDAQLSVSDINLDGRTDINDATYIQRVLVDLT